MRWIALILAFLAVVVILVVVIGMLLPVSHVASVSGEIPAPREQVFAALSDVRLAATWRSDIDSVAVLSKEGEPLRWREVGGSGSLAFVRDEMDPPRRIVSRIDGRDQGFGGRWIWELTPGSTGTEVTVTEEGEVYNPLFRFMSRFVFGHHRTMESVLKDLGTRFGADVQTRRLE